MTVESSQQQQQQQDAMAAQKAAASLQLLLQEDPALIQYGLTIPNNNNNTNTPDAVAFQYAAALLQAGNNNADSSSSSSSSTTAQLALQEVERKLALTESLAVKLSRTSPEAVTGHLLRLHGYHNHNTMVGAENKNNNSDSSAEANTGMTVSTATTTTSSSSSPNNTTMTLNAIRDRALRLERSAESLEGTCTRVETSVTKALTKLQISTSTLERVLAISSTLKMILRLQFETAKLVSYDLDDVRDLTRAAASVAILEDLLLQQQPQHSTMSKNDTTSSSPIHVVEWMKPAALQTAQAVRRAAQALLQEQQQPASIGNIHQLGAVLQVYYNLGELPTAVWQAVDHAHHLAVTATKQLFNPITIGQQLNDQVTKLLAQSQKLGAAAGTSTTTRDVAKLRKQVRASVTVQWAQGVLEAATQVRNVHRVLQRKTDPKSRVSYVSVVATAPKPKAYQIATTNNPTTTASTKSTTTNTNTTDNNDASSFSLFDLFWMRFCHTLATVIEEMLEQTTNDAVRADVAALYPAVRAAALEMVGHLQESSRFSGSAATFLDDATGTFATGGILGGVASLQDAFLDGNFAYAGDNENPQAAAANTSADTWTSPSVSTVDLPSPTAATSALGAAAAVAPQYLNALSAAVIHSNEWKTLQGRGGKDGLYPLQQAFLQACQDRLTAPLQYMFPEAVTMDDEGVAISSGLALLPSKYDIQRFDENIRLELSLADPREGGGDLTAVTMIAECVVSMISEFCVRAKAAMSGVSESGLVNDSDWSMSESMQHDRKVVAIMYTLKQYLQNAPEKTFVAPYRPAVLPQHLDAANLCTNALSPALTAIDNTVKFVVLLPLCRALNRRVGTALAKMHSAGVYLDTATSSSNKSDGIIDDGNDAPSFVQKELTVILDLIAEKHLARFPPIYASVIAVNVTAYTIYTFLSNASLLRPLSESARLHLTQDLADLELALEQLASKTGSTLTLHQVENGKPYAELRAVRQMLFWSGLENKGKPADEVAKSLLREVWTKEMRVSTLFHYLFSFGPSMLSSPHHAKRTSAAEYVSTLVQLDGSTVAGEDTAWMTIMSCCESYVQRASATTTVATNGGGDIRIAQIVMSLGQELLRRRGRS